MLQARLEGRRAGLLLALDQHDDVHVELVCVQELARRVRDGQHGPLVVTDAAAVHVAVAAMQSPWIRIPAVTGRHTVVVAVKQAPAARALGAERAEHHGVRAPPRRQQLHITRAQLHQGRAQKVRCLTRVFPVFVVGVHRRAVRYGFVAHKLREPLQERRRIRPRHRRRGAEAGVVPQAYVAVRGARQEQRRMSEPRVRPRRRRRMQCEALHVLGMRRKAAAASEVAVEAAHGTVRAAGPKHVRIAFGQRLEAQHVFGVRWQHADGCEAFHVPHIDRPSLLAGEQRAFPRRQRKNGIARRVRQDQRAEQGRGSTTQAP